MFGWLSKAYNWVLGKIDGTTASWVNDLIQGVWGFLTSLFGGIIDAWNTFYSDVSTFVTGLEAFSKEVWNWVSWFTDLFWKQWLAWVSKYIIKPLDEAWDWIRDEGAYMWHLLTHPADLVDFFWTALISKLESEAWTVGKVLGEFLLSLVINNLTKFATLIEDIIDAIF